MKRIIAIYLLFISISGYASSINEDIGDIMNATASSLGFSGNIIYNADTGNEFVLPNEGFDLTLDLFCEEMSKNHSWIFVRYIFKADLNGNHKAYECQRLEENEETEESKESKESI
jgi:hypothetical protein